MKVLQFSFRKPEHNAAGGIEKFIYELSLYLKRLYGTEIDTLYLSDKDTIEKTEYGRAIGLKGPLFRSLGSAQITAEKRFYNRRLRKFVREHGKEYDIIHVHGDIGGFRELANCNTIVTMHGFSIAAYKYRGFISRKIVNITSGRAEINNIRNAKAAFAVSGRIKGLIQKTIKAKIGVIYPATDTDFFNPLSSMSRKSLRKRLGFKDKTMYLFFLGNDAYRKGLDIAIDAVELSKTPMQINAIGKLAEIRKSDKVKLLGFVDEKEKREYLQASDILIMPSRFEGFAAVPLEGMACGLPCVLSNQTGTNEIVTNNINGIVIDDFDPRYYSMALEKLASDMNFKNRMSRAARANVLGHNWAHMAEKYYKIYKKLMLSEEQKNKKNEIRIAILSHSPMYKGISGSDKYNDRLANGLYTYNKKMAVNTFVFSSRDKTTYTKTYTENEVKGGEYPGGGISLPRIKDLLSLVVLGTRPSIERANRNIRFLLKLEEFNPDVIINFDLTLSKIIANYKKRNPKVKIIFEYDSYKSIYNIADSVGIKENSILNPFKRLLRKRYIEYYMRMYEQMLDISDRAIMATEKFMKEVGERFPKYKSKLFVIPGVIARNASASKVRKISSINTVLFIGGYQNVPNKQAINIIEKEIAPQSTDRTFIIAGLGCPKLRHGNVEFLGELSEEELYDCIQNTDLCISPLISGTGMKAKILDYLMQGKAILGTDVAFEGYGIKDNVNGFIENRVANFPERIAKLSRNLRLINKVCENAKEAAKSFHEKKIVGEWSNLIFEMLNE